MRKSLTWGFGDKPRLRGGREGKYLFIKRSSFTTPQNRDAAKTKRRTHKVTSKLTPKKKIKKRTKRKATHRYSQPLPPLSQASTTAYLTSCYALGVRDGHDDNIMLREEIN